MPEEQHVAFVLGTRPEIIKLAPLILAADESDLAFSIIHTGQHYSESLDDVFFDKLELPEPDYHLSVGSGSHADQTGQMMRRLDSVIPDIRPTHVLVQGDTNSTLAGGLVAAKREPILGHVEAGLRSGNRTMPEETNRRIIDHTADILYAPTDTAMDNLYREGLDDRAILTGNTIVEAVEKFRDVAANRSAVLNELALRNEEFLLATVHRAENVDDPDRFASLINGLETVGQTFDLDVIYPVHPRARSQLEDFNLSPSDPIRLIEPLNFFDFLHLEDTAQLVLTDSGGVQEEACILGTPCVTLRSETERPETLRVGANLLAGSNPAEIRRQVETQISSDTDWENPFGDGSATTEILASITAEQ